MEKKPTELNDTFHQETLKGGERRFPLESYRQLRATGVSKKEAVAMLGFTEDECPDDLK